MGTTKMKDKIEFIKRYYTSAFKSQELFLEGLLDDLEDTEGMSMCLCLAKIETDKKVLTKKLYKEEVQKVKLIQCINFYRSKIR
ncbi:hypothetical protein BHR23_02410 [Campylobacter upsaliensis]|nr:hypothetical protein [Campylobacter upsaliensis]